MNEGRNGEFNLQVWNAYRNYLKEDHWEETEQYLPKNQRDWENYPELRRVWQELCEGVGSSGTGLGEDIFSFL